MIRVTLAMLLLGTFAFTARAEDKKAEKEEAKKDNKKSEKSKDDKKAEKSCKIHTCYEPRTGPYRCSVCE